MTSFIAQRRAALLVLVIALTLFAANAALADVLNDIGNGYKTESAKWFPKLLVIAKSLFWKLAAIEFAWASILWVLKSQEMQSFTAAVVQKLIGIGFFYFLLQNADYWIPAIVNSLVKAGNEATGLPALTPSEVFDLGIDTAVGMLKGIQALSLWEDFATVVVGGLAALVIVISFLIIAGQMLIALIESYIAISGGVLFLGFGGSRWTVEFTQKYISYAFATGIKLFILYLIIGVGTAQAKTWASLLLTTDWNNIFAVMGGSMLLAFLGFQIPNMAASMLSGAPSLTAGAAAATSGALAAGTVAAGATAISPALQSARGGMQALRAGYDHHRAGGSNALSSALKAVGTSTVDMGREAGRSAGEAIGLAKPTASERSTVGGRAAERRDGMMAQIREERAAMAEAGGMSKSSENDAGATGAPAESDSAKNGSADGKSTSAAPVVPPPATPSGATGSAVDELHGASKPMAGHPQVADDYGNVVAPPSSKIAESNAGGAGTSATNVAAASTSAVNTSATGVNAAQAGSSGSVPAQTLATATPEAQRQVSQDSGSTVYPPSAKIAESDAGEAGTSAAGVSSTNTSAGNTSTTDKAASSGGGSSAPAPEAGKSGPTLGRDKTPFQDLQRIRPPQIPNDAAPQAGVNIRLTHSAD
ncbi:P-type conjugative transfer protein TrbL [Paracidovorax avenae]|uniref:P-type conjugative transfer protein TrbL n=1 Tax=Paracidovorax avenae TaxID=80867 RepID=UPI000D16E2F2|nr:P-type conjugative transfer protein TrbL [Paracidovorax avenae]AVT18942.1 P-type conjugative transfer protein TrbL [Paracidovorax avenae]